MARVTYPDWVIEEARILFMTLNEAGDRAYTDNAIRNKVNEIIANKSQETGFYSNLSTHTVPEWSKRFGWKEQIANEKEIALQQAEQARLQMLENRKQVRAGETIKRQGIIRKSFDDNNEIHDISRSLVKFKLQCTLAARTGVGMKQIMEKYGLAEEEVAIRAYSDLELNKIYHKSVDTQLEHVKILANVTPEDQLREMLENDEEWQKDRAQILIYMKENDQDIARNARWLLEQDFSEVVN